MCDSSIITHLLARRSQIDTLFAQLNPLDRSGLHCTERSAQALHNSSLAGKVWIHLNRGDKNCLECRSQRLTRQPDSSSPHRIATRWTDQPTRTQSQPDTASCSWTQRGSRSQCCTVYRCLSCCQGRSCLHHTSSGSLTHLHTQSPHRTAAAPTRWGSRSRHCTSSGLRSPLDKSCPAHSSQHSTLLMDNSSQRRRT